MFDKIFAQRLTALANHLETAETLRVGLFDFNRIYVKMSCGTAGCAMGEAALLWPDEIPMGITGDIAWEDCFNFFGLTDAEGDHLFYAYSQKTSQYGGDCLTGDATRYEVAANIRAFLEVKAKQAQ